MRNVRLAFGTSSSFGIPIEEQIRLFKEIGFDGFFTNWTPDSDIALYRKTADETGMIYQSIHAPFTKMRDMWYENADIAVEELKACLNDCAKYSVPVMVTHVYIGFDNAKPTEIGIKNFEKVVDEAEKLGVKIAFENTEGEEQLALLMKHFADRECVGFCWDTGHELCYNKSKDMLALYGDRLIATHLNDNLGIKDFDGNITYLDDLHLLPFDGIADWKGIADRLKKHNYSGILTFELKTKNQPGRHENDIYDRMPIEDYFVEVFKRACRVGALMM